MVKPSPLIFFQHTAPMMMFDIIQTLLTGLGCYVIQMLAIRIRKCRCNLAFSPKFLWR